MKRIICLAAFIALALTTASAQNPRTVPTPQDTEAVVKISTNLIQVDVSVTDAKGKMVRDLRPEDFEIYENGERQTLSGFRFVSSILPSNDMTKTPVDKTALPMPSTGLRPEQVRRTFALVVDDLMLSFESANKTRRALRRFVDEQVQDGDLVAIIRTGGGIGALQQFTTDKRQLYSAVERIKWNPSSTGGVEALPPIEPTPMEIARASGDSSVSAQDLEQERNSIRSFSEFRDKVFTTGSLGAIRYIVAGMSELPGRKSIILFSDGFSLLVRNELGGTDGGAILDFLRQIVDLANRSSIVFYTIDARGLQTTGITARDKILDPTPQRLQATLSARAGLLYETQGGLQYLADETGGFSFIDNNDLVGGLRNVLDDQSYYLLGYEPDSETFDPLKRRFNKLEIKVRRSGLNVRYRSGFFNVATESLRKAKPSLPANRTGQRLSEALNSPFAVSDIAVRLNLLFANDTVNGSFVKSLLHLDAKDLKFSTEANNIRKAAFEIMVTSFGDNGVPVDTVTRAFSLTANEKNYDRLQREGIIYHVVSPVRKPGAYQYRVAVRDSQTDRIGTASQFIEVPDITNDQHVVSGIVLDSFSTDQWQKIIAETNTAAELPSNELSDTSLRRFRSDSVLRYGFEVYNPRLDTRQRPHLSTRIRLVRDGQLVMDGKTVPLDVEGQIDMSRIRSVGVVAFGKGTPPGEYILQVIVIDELAKPKQRISTQFVQFEIVD